MPNLFVKLFRPISGPGESKLDVGFPLAMLIILAIACAFPMVQLHGWAIGITTFFIAFLILSAMRATAIHLVADKNGYISPSNDGMAHMGSLLICLAVTALWWLICGIFLGWDNFLSR